ncbi:TetR/AcrR family transcriptional regulator [uncultured Cohaesibacter sp.]|uniref:TetR/AcrR family transcriptional regulator n=1 Tax=uncultured Cohaesibacter sp. TaxID=1002546 RepID=UPI00293185E2|nr:TetR/AcrR family transcriptional regulator [uncultured Cohaesibacter sp.]
MTKAHHREKNPQKVRRLLIENALKLASEKGLALVSIQQVCRASGVTKGAFFHHFTNKQSLLDAVFAEMIDELDREIDAYIEDDPVPHGQFTRAYLQSVKASVKDSPSAAIWISAITDASLQSVWNNWLNQRLVRHRQTDDGEVLHAVRMAADGIWFAVFTGSDANQFSTLYTQLFKMTQQ